MTYSNFEKTAVVLNLMGEDFAEVILSKLPRDIVQRIQEEVIPLMDHVEMPSDIDAFVLDEIVRESVGQPIEAAVDEFNSNDMSAEKVDTWDPLTCDDETLLSLVDVTVASNVLMGQNRAFQRILFGFFSDAKQKQILEQLTERHIQLPARVEPTAIMEKMEPSIKQAFLAKLRTEANQEMRRE